MQIMASRKFLIAVLVAIAGASVGASAVTGIGPGNQIVATGQDTVENALAPPDSPAAPENIDAAAAAAVDSRPDDYINETEVAMWIHHYVNQERNSDGESSIDLNTELTDIADAYAHRMANEGFYGHEDPSGQGFQGRYREAGFNCEIRSGGLVYTGGENLIQTYWRTDVQPSLSVEEEYYNTEKELAKGIVDSWMRSPGHSMNIMKSYWNREGIGVAAIESDGETEIYAVQNFC